MMMTFESYGKLPRVYTSHQAAQICQLSPREIMRSMDVGRLKGYKIPQSEHRRIPASSLQTFADAHGLEVDVPVDRVFVLFAQYRELLVRTIQRLMEDTLDASKIHLVTSSFDAGMAIAEDPYIENLYFDATQGTVPKGVREGFAGRISEHATAEAIVSYLRGLELLTVQNLFNPGSEIPKSLLRHPQEEQLVIKPRIAS